MAASYHGYTMAVSEAELNTVISEDLQWLTGQEMSTFEVHFHMRQLSPPSLTIPCMSICTRARRNENKRSSFLFYFSIMYLLFSGGRNVVAYLLWIQFQYKSYWPKGSLSIQMNCNPQKLSYYKSHHCLQSSSNLCFLLSYESSANLENRITTLLVSFLTVLQALSWEDVNFPAVYCTLYYRRSWPYLKLSLKHT